MSYPDDDQPRFIVSFDRNRNSICVFDCETGDHLCHTGSYAHAEKRADELNNRPIPRQRATLTI